MSEGRFMNKVQCVHGNNRDQANSNYLDKLIKDLGYEVEFFDLDNFELGNSYPMIMIIQSEHLNEFKNIFNKRDQRVLVALNSRKDFKIVSELSENFDKIFGFIDLSQELEYNKPILNNYLLLNFPKDSSVMTSLTSDLDKIYEFTKTELQKIKNLHDRVVKIRVDQLKGATLSSKFMAGEKSGGEFFEVIQNDQEIFFIQAGSNSYLLTSLILSEIELLKERSTLGNFHDQVLKFQKVISHHATENNSELNYCIMNLNSKTLIASFALKGKGHIFYQGEVISFEEEIKLRLKPRDKLVVISEGAMQNWELLAKNSVKKFFVQNQELATRELITEFFFEVSRNKTGSFLIYDALLAVVEIDENILYQLS
jgi:hypothetical protein